MRRLGNEKLSQRQVQIVKFVARGAVNKEIAAQLNISENTVATHMKRIFLKMDVNSRAAMVYRCAEIIE